MSETNVFKKLEESKGRDGFTLEELKMAIHEINKEIVKEGEKLSKSGSKSKLSSSILKSINEEKVSKKTVQKTIAVLLLRETIDVKIECFKGYEMKKILGTGGYGVVSNACFKKNCNYAVKIMKLEDKEDNDRFDLEVKVTELFNTKNIGPKFYTSWKCDGMGFVVTEMWDRALEDGEPLPVGLFDHIKFQVRQIHKLGYIHGDIMPKNILVKEKGGMIRDITLTDFGISDTIENYKNGKSAITIKQLHEYHDDSYHGIPYIRELYLDPTHLDRGWIDSYE